MNRRNNAYADNVFENPALNDGCFLNFCLAYDIAGEESGVVWRYTFTDASGEETASLFRVGLNRCRVFGQKLQIFG
jgi:hypothetical protein